MFEYLNCRIPKRIEEDLEHVSAVMVPLLKKTDGYHILFEVRSKKLNRQPGEICFPGGRVEPGETPKEAALRETQEELLIESKDLKLYGALDYFLSPAQARIEPFLGELTNYHGQFSEAEVDSVFTVPLQFFLETPPDIYYRTFEEFSVLRYSGRHKLSVGHRPLRSMFLPISRPCDLGNDGKNSFKQSQISYQRIIKRPRKVFLTFFGLFLVSMFYCWMKFSTFGTICFFLDITPGRTAR